MITWDLYLFLILILGVCLTICISIIRNLRSSISSTASILAENAELKSKLDMQQVGMDAVTNQLNHTSYLLKEKTEMYAATQAEFTNLNLNLATANEIAISQEYQLRQYQQVIDNKDLLAEFIRWKEARVQQETMLQTLMGVSAVAPQSEEAPFKNTTLSDRPISTMLSTTVPISGLMPVLAETPTENLAPSAGQQTALAHEENARLFFTQDVSCTDRESVAFKSKPYATENKYSDGPDTSIPENN